MALLQKAIKKRDDIKVDVAAILNDTTGCLMSCAWKNKNCRIGLIIGTGTNACYLEDLDEVQLFKIEREGHSIMDKVVSFQVELWDGDYKQPKHVIVNTEWGK